MQDPWQTLPFYSSSFFLVTAVIPNDKGINRKLARICPTGEDCNVVIKEKKLLRITINGNQELMIENGGMAIKLYSKISEVISRRLRRTNTRATNIGAQYDSGRTRKEHDLLGDRNVPEGKYYGIKTKRISD